MSSPRRAGQRDAETTAERHDRNLSDLLQGLQVAGLGVGVLFGFLLSLLCTVRFSRLDASQRDLRVAGLLLAALSSARLIAPVACHCWVFRLHEKAFLRRAPNVTALAGVVTVALFPSAAVWLALNVVLIGNAVAACSAGTVAVCGMLWFALPIAARSTSSN